MVITSVSFSVVYCTGRVSRRAGWGRPAKKEKDEGLAGHGP
jgi:hypothetical protein